MKTIKKIFISAVFVFMILAFGAVMSSCGGNIPVDLYDGDVLIKQVNVRNGAEYDLGIAEKTGYMFLGWYSQKDGGSAYTDAQGNSAGMKWKEENTTTLYAHWEAIEYKISLDYCDATSQGSIKEISAKYDEKITEKLPVPKKAGCSFTGWFTEKTGGSQITDSLGNLLVEAEIYNNSIYPIGDGGTTLYAQFGEKTVTYVFQTDGSAVESVTYPVGTVLYELPSSIKDNYCFESWCFDATYISGIKFPYTIPESSDEYVNLYANFIIGSNDVLQFNTISSTGDREYEVTYIGDAEKIVIPDSYYGKKITRIRKIESSSVKEIIIPQTVKEFINGAFQNCTSLEKINIPSSVKVIPEKTFLNCESLKEILIPRKLTTIGKEAFSGCSSIKSIDIPALVQTIGSGAFRNMGSLEKFIIHESNEKYMVVDDVLYYKVGNSSYLFQYPASKQGETYELHESTVKIMEYAFSSSKISTISISGKITAIEKGAFENCKNLVNVSISGDSFSFKIDSGAFSNCSNLKALKIEHEKVPMLGTSVFEGTPDTFSVYVTSDMVRSYQMATNWRNISSKIYSLGTIFGDFAIEEINGEYTIRQYFGTNKEVVIPEILNAHKIVKISENAFALSEIEKITISQHITEIGDNAFKNCANLKSIIVECAPPLLGEGVFDGINADFGVYVKNTTDVLDSYRIADGWIEITDKIWSY